MSKTTITLALFGLIALGVVGAVFIIIFAPESTGVFLNWIGTITAFGLSAAITLLGLDKLNTKVDQVAKNTNGTNNALLEAALTGQPMTAARIAEIKAAAPVEPTALVAPQTVSAANDNYQPKHEMEN